MTTQFKILGLLLLLTAVVVGCDGLASSTAKPAKPVDVVAPLPEASPPLGTPGGGARVDVNPPGGGIHVKVPPNENGEGVNVDVGGGNGVRVTPRP